MKQLDHPNIVHVYEFTECPLGFYMDFVDGPNLRALGRGVAEPIAQVELLLRIAETIRHAHSRKVVHRDINLRILYSLGRHQSMLDSLFDGF